MRLSSPRRWWVDGARIGVVMGALMAGAPAAAAQSSDLIEYGQHLAAGCAPCHQVETTKDRGNYTGSGRIIGHPPEVFIRKLKEQESGGANPLMRQIAQELSEEERAALAAYLALQSD